MPVDTSIYANAAPQQPNPLAMAGQVASFQNAQNQNRLFQQEFGANKAYGNIIQQATDPTTGQTDFNRANALAAQNPATAFKAPEFAAQALARQQAQTGLDASKVDLYNKHLDTVSQTITPLLTLGKQGSLTLPDVYKALGNLVADKNSQIGVSDIQPILGELPTQGPNGGPPTNAQLMQVVTQFALRNENSRAQLAAINGTPMAVAHGGGTAVIAPSTVTGQTTMLGDITNTTSPGEKMARIPTFVAGQPGSIPQGAIADQYGNPIAPGAQPATSGTSPLGTGRYPAQGAPVASGAAPGAPAGFVASGPKLGVGAAADVAASGSAKSYQDLHDTVANSGTRLYQLQQGLQALQGANTGKGSQTPQDIQSYIQTLAPDIAKSLGVDPQKIANYDEATKYLTGYAQTQAGSFGSHTDSQLATALTANPSTHISNLAATDVVKANIGLERMKQAQAQAFDESGLPPEEFNKWQVQWNKGVDPRAYMVDQLSPDKYKAMVGAMKPAEKSAFYENLNKAISSGYVTLPGQPNAR